MDDVALVAAVQRGNEEALADLFEECHGWTYSTCLNALRDPEAAEEATARVFEVAIRTRLAGAHALRPAMIRLIHEACVEVEQERRRRTPRKGEQPPAAPDPTNLRLVAWRAAGDLTPADRILFSLAAGMALTNESIAMAVSSDKPAAITKRLDAIREHVVADVVAARSLDDCPDLRDTLRYSAKEPDAAARKKVHAHIAGKGRGASPCKKCTTTYERWPLAALAALLPLTPVPSGLNDRLLDRMELALRAVQAAGTDRDRAGSGDRSHPIIDGVMAEVESGRSHPPVSTANRASSERASSHAPRAERVGAERVGAERAAPPMTGHRATDRADLPRAAERPEPTRRPERPEPARRPEEHRPSARAEAPRTRPEPTPTKQQEPPSRPSTRPESAPQPSARQEPAPDRSEQPEPTPVETDTPANPWFEDSASRSSRLNAASTPNAAANTPDDETTGTKRSRPVTTAAVLTATVLVLGVAGIAALATHRAPAKTAESLVIEPTTSPAAAPKKRLPTPPKPSRTTAPARLTTSSEVETVAEPSAKPSIRPVAGSAAPSKSADPFHTFGTLTIASPGETLAYDDAEARVASATLAVDVPEGFDPALLDGALTWSGSYVRQQETQYADLGTGQNITVDLQGAPRCTTVWTITATLTPPNGAAPQYATTEVSVTC